MKRFFASFYALLFAVFLAQPLLAADAPHTVILVHGAFADGSSWNRIIPLLQAKGLKVIAVQNPLTSLADDVKAVKRAVDGQTGKITLVGHSWGGMVITEAGNDPKVVSLVYVAALAPAAGQSAGDLFKDYPASPGLSNVLTDAAGFQTLTPAAVAQDFAQDLPAEETAIMAVTQGPIAGQCFAEKVSKAAWKDKKSWYIVAEQDRMIQPDLQKDLAQRINATTLSLPSSHVPMLSKPEEVANVIFVATQVDDGTSSESR